MDYTVKLGRPTQLYLDTRLSGDSGTAVACGDGSMGAGLMPRIAERLINGGMALRAARSYVCIKSNRAHCICGGVSVSDARRPINPSYGA